MSKGHHFVYHNFYIKQQTCENLGSIGHRSWEKITGKPTLVFACFAAWHVFKINPQLSISRIDNCFNVFSKSKAFHGIIFQEKSFTITFCKPCKLFVNLLFIFLFRKCPMASMNGKLFWLLTQFLHGPSHSWQGRGKVHLMKKEGEEREHLS